MSKHGTNCEVALTICVMAYLNDDVTGCKAWGCSHILLKFFVILKKKLSDISYKTIDLFKAKDKKRCTRKST